MPAYPNLLRPAQVAENTAEISRLEETIRQPHIQDRPTAMRQLRALQRTVNEFTPKPFEGKEKDAAAKQEQVLREAMLQGMPTKAEMRLNPPGAVGKLQRWTKANGEKIQAWKYLQLRLHAGDDDPDVANFERFRPEGGAQELSLSGAQIERKAFHNLGTTGVVTLTEEEIGELGKLNPELREKVSFLDNDTRALIREIVRGVLAQPETPKPKREWTDEQRKAAGERLAAARARKAAAVVTEQPAAPAG